MNKILVNDYLKQLNKEVDYLNQYRESIHVNKLTCKELAALAQVTPATITNLTTDSKLSLIDNISEIIYDNYYELFENKTSKSLSNYKNLLKEDFNENLTYGYINYCPSQILLDLIRLYID